MLNYTTFSGSLFTGNIFRKKLKKIIQMSEELPHYYGKKYVSSKNIRFLYGAFYTNFRKTL